MFLSPIPFLILPFLVAIVVALIRGKRATPGLTEPHCAKCGYDLRTYTAEPPTRCSECGSDLTAPHAVRWGEMPKPRGKIILLAVVLALITPIFTLFLLKRAMVRPMAATVVGPAALLSASNQSLLASLPQTVQQPWTWQELDRRLLSGAVSNSEATSAVDILIADLSKRTGSQPLTWSDQFVTHAITRGMISPSQYTRLAQAYNGTPKLRIATKVRQGKRLSFMLEYGNPFPLPGVILLKSLQQVKLSDGPEIQTTAQSDPNNGRGLPNPDYLSATASQIIYGNLKLDLPPGKYTAIFKIDAGELVSSGPGISNEPGQPIHWPSPVRSRWTVQLAAPFELVAPDQSPLVLVTDPTLDPQLIGKITVKALRAIHYGDGQRIVAEMSVDGTELPCCFSVALRINGEEHPLGIVFAASGTANWNGSCNLPSLSPDVHSVDLILRPDPTRAELSIGIDRMWGGTINLLNQRLQRYDIESQSPATQ